MNYIIFGLTVTIAYTFIGGMAAAVVFLIWIAIIAAQKTEIKEEK